MIINKSQFKYQRKYRGHWPFTVPQVSVMMMLIHDVKFYALIHNFQAYALSRGLEKHGFQTLDESGIWNDKHLGAFFDFIYKQSETVFGGRDEIS